MRWKLQVSVGLVFLSLGVLNATAQQTKAQADFGKAFLAERDSRDCVLKMLHGRSSRLANVLVWVGEKAFDFREGRKVVQLVQFIHCVLPDNGIAGVQCFLQQGNRQFWMMASEIAQGAAADVGGSATKQRGDRRPRPWAAKARQRIDGFSNNHRPSIRQKATSKGANRRLLRLREFLLDTGQGEKDGTQL